MTKASEFEIFNCPLDAMVLIEASAGTGKTYNICALYLRLLLESPHRSVREILVVTFTTAATAELKSRIRARITEVLFFLNAQDRHHREKLKEDAFLQKLELWIEQTGRDISELKKRLQQALTSFDEAAIFTIHGFCQAILKSKAFSAGQTFSATVEPDEQEIVMEVVNDFWRKHVAYANASPELLSWMAHKGISPQTFRDFLLRSYRKPLAELRSPGEHSTDRTPDFTELARAFDKMRQCWTKEQATIHSLITTAIGRKDLNGRTYKTEIIAPLFSAYEALFQANDALALSTTKKNRSRFSQLTQQGLQSKTNSGKTTPAHVFFELTEKWLLLFDAAHNWLEAVYHQLLIALLDEMETVRRKKQERRVMSYDDMLYNLHAALTNGNTGRQLAQFIRQTYTAALIDEFQDTDPVQFSIFNAIYGNTELPVFLVGDPKQAIYRFRNADLYTYFKAGKSVSARYSLTDNQRSTERLISACNTLFMQNSNAFMLEGLDYTKVSVGARKRNQIVDLTITPAEQADGMVLWQLPAGTEHSHLTRSEAKKASTIAVASEIARLLHASAEDKIKIAGKRLAGSDILVLVRSHSDGSVIRKMLENYGIASVTFSQESVWNTSDAKELSLVLYAVVHPRNNARINAALTTELLGLDSGKMELLAENDEATLEELEKFAQYHDNWVNRGVSFMLRQLMSERDIYSSMLKRQDGERRLTNLFHLAELITIAAQTHRTPEALMRWFTQQMVNRADADDSQLRLESDDDLVRIRTIHGAKGLEAPIVFCPYLWDAHPRSVTNRFPGLSYHDGENLVFDLGPKSEEEKNRIKSSLRNEQREEDMRLLYVALTRAVYRCYVVVGCYLRSGKDAPSPLQSSRGLLNWLVAGNEETVSNWFNREINRLDAIDAAWRKLAHPGNGITISPLPAESAPPQAPGLSVADRTQSELRAVPVTKTIPQSWRISSYSGLIFGAEYDPMGSDYDENMQDSVTVTESGPEPEEPLHPEDIFHFPAHRYAGNCLHKVFEQVDFTDDSTWDKAIKDALLYHPPHAYVGMESKEDEELWPLMIKNMLKNVFETPLREGIRLADIDSSRRITELEFVFPTRSLAPEALNSLFHGDYAIPPLVFRKFDGYIRGFIDLVFEYDGRFYILDWKSNKLGKHKSDYDRNAIDQAMKQGYHLQHLLYSLALDRYLAQCVPDYDYEKHFGGVFYLFVRGVRPDWKTASGEPYGVYFHRAKASIIEALFRIIQTGEA